MKRTVTLPRVYRPGKGHPAETLAYLNPMEHDLIRQLTDGMAQRGPKGVRSYAVTSGTTSGTTMGGGGGNNNGYGGGGNRGPGGGALSAPARTQPSANVQSGVIGSRSPASDPLSDPARTEPSKAVSPVSALGPSTTAFSKVSQAAQQNAMKPNPVGSATATQWGGPPTSAPLTAPNGSYYGPKGINSLNTSARMAAARSVGFSQPSVTRTPGDAEMLGRMMMAESSSIKNPLGGISTPGLQGVGDVVRNRMLSERFPDTVQGVLGQKKQFSPMFDGSFARTPANPMATRVAESILSGESPPVVGNALNYGNLNTINNRAGYSSAATRSAFNAMTPTATIADARNPQSLSHTFGTIGNNSDVAFNSIPSAPVAPSMPSAPVRMASVVPATVPATVADAAPSIWQKPDIGGWIKAKTGVDVGQVAQQAAAGNKFVAEHPVLSKLAGAVLSGFGGAGGASPNSPFGTAQDRSKFTQPPRPPQAPQMASAGGGRQSPDAMTSLLQLQQNMLQKGASPEELAYVQSLIQELSNSQVA